MVSSQALGAIHTRWAEAGARYDTLLAAYQAEPTPEGLAAVNAVADEMSAACAEVAAERPCPRPGHVLVLRADHPSGLSQNGFRWPGIEANVPYRLDDNGNFVRADAKKEG